MPRLMPIKSSLSLSMFIKSIIDVYIFIQCGIRSNKVGEFSLKIKIFAMYCIRQKMMHMSVPLEKSCSCYTHYPRHPHCKLVYMKHSLRVC